MRKAPVCVLLFGAAAAACTTASAPRDYGDPTATTTPTTDDGIVAYFVEPRTQAVSLQAQVSVVVAAYSEDGQAIAVNVATTVTDPTPAALTGNPGPSQRFATTIPLVGGDNAINVTIETADGAHFRRLQGVIAYEGAAPGIAFKVSAPAAADGSCSQTTPLASNVIGASSVCVDGIATVGSSTLASVTLSASGGDPISATLDPSGHFAATVPLDQNATASIVGTATDARNRSTTTTVSIIDDATPPVVTLTAPGSVGPFYTDADTIDLGGTATDDNGLQALRIRTSGGGTASIAAVSPWTATVPLEDGENDVQIVATDVAGNTTTVPVSIVKSRVMVLHAPAMNAGETKLLLDATALSELLSVSDQQSLEMVTVPMRPSIVSALHQIRDPEQNGIDVTTWGTPEQNMNRLLNMTPDNANLKGSSVEELLGLGTAVGLPPARLLANLFSSTVTTTFVDLDTAADVILEQLVGTHPNISKGDDGEPALSINLYDVFQDLHTLAARFGPAGDHPGFLTGTTESIVLQPGFRMALPVKSNLLQYDGVDASVGDRAELFASTGGDVLALDFSSPDFSVVGLTDEPTVDLQLVMTENPAFLHAGDTQAAGADATRPGFYRGNSEAFTVPPWQFENIVDETAYRQFVELYASSQYVTTQSYDAGSIKNAAVIGWDRGWVDITTAGGIGNPPAPQYAWDVLLETAELRLHDGGLAEGQANLGFALKGVSIGLTADDIVAKMKPTLQAQSGKLSSLIAGTTGLAASTCDFYLATGDNGAPGQFLFFRAAGDSTGDYAYQTPGFFSDGALTTKVSTTAALPGTTDTTHEKVVPTTGQTLYVKDDAGVVYRVDIVATDATTVSLRVRPGTS